MFRPSSDAQHFSAEPSFDEAHETNWHVMEVEIDQHLCPEENYPNTRFRRNKPPRFATVAELSASIAHQLNQPLTSMLANAHAAKCWLAAEAPNLMEAIASIDRIAREVRAAGETGAHSGTLQTRVFRQERSQRPRHDARRSSFGCGSPQ